MEHDQHAARGRNGGRAPSAETPVTALPTIRLVARLRSELRELRAERDAALRTVAAIRGSRAWRLLAPRRRLAEWAPRATRERMDDAPAVKAAFRARCADALASFLASGARIALPAANDPDVSILLVLFNQAEFTFHCLESLAHGTGVEVEVILLDNGSADRTPDLLGRIDGARVVRAGENLHFVHGVNRAAQDARGRYLLLLNNDTRVEPGAIAAAAARLDAEPDLGAAGRILVLDARDWRRDAAALHPDGPALSRLLAGQGFAVTFCAPRALSDADGRGDVECAGFGRPDDAAALLRSRAGHYDAVMLLAAEELAAGVLAEIEGGLDGALLLRVPHR